MKQSHTPLLVDHPLVNSTRFLEAVTTYKNNIAEMLDYIQLFSVASINRTNKQVNDSVTNQVNFFHQLNEGSLPIKNNMKGVNNKRYLSEDETVYDTQLPENFGLGDLIQKDTQFILYWVEKYRLAHDTVKQILHQHG